MDLLIGSDRVGGRNGDTGGFEFQMAYTFDSHPGCSEGRRHKTLLELAGRYVATHGIGQLAEMYAAAMAWNKRNERPLSAVTIIDSQSIETIDGSFAVCLVS